MHEATVSRHQVVCEIPGLLPRFYLFIIIIIFFDPDVFYNLENVNELDIGHPVRI